jgi:hypothetical protein
MQSKDVQKYYHFQTQTTNFLMTYRTSASLQVFRRYDRMAVTIHQWIVLYRYHLIEEFAEAYVARSAMQHL